MSAEPTQGAMADALADELRAEACEPAARLFPGQSTSVQAEVEACASVSPPGQAVKYYLHFRESRTLVELEHVLFARQSNEDVYYFVSDDVCLRNVTTKDILPGGLAVGATE